MDERKGEIVVTYPAALELSTCDEGGILGGAGNLLLLVEVDGEVGVVLGLDLGFDDLSFERQQLACHKSWSAYCVPRRSHPRHQPQGRRQREHHASRSLPREGAQHQGPG